MLDTTWLGTSEITFTCKELDEESARFLTEDLLDLAHQQGWYHWCLDLSAVEVMASAILTQLLVLHRHLHDAGGRLELVNVNPFLYDFFQIVGLTDVLNLRERDLVTL